jgi:hypothetical protein
MSDRIQLGWLDKTKSESGLKLEQKITTTAESFFKKMQILRDLYEGSLSA